jgi:hypothetical protein
MDHLHGALRRKVTDDEEIMTLCGRPTVWVLVTNVTDGRTIHNYDKRYTLKSTERSRVNSFL